MPEVTEHELKCWPEFFSAIVSGEKTFELRKDDRGFKVGDVLRLREWSPARPEAHGGYTGRSLRVTVSYVLSGWALADGYVVMGIKLIPQRTDPPISPKRSVEVTAANRERRARFECYADDLRAGRWAGVADRSLDGSALVDLLVRVDIEAEARGAESRQGEIDALKKDAYECSRQFTEADTARLRARRLLRRLLDAVNNTEDLASATVLMVVMAEAEAALAEGGNRG